MYRYALTQEEKLVDIINITKENKDNEYICISCGNKLIPKLGSIRIHHFSHFVKNEICSYETYLHKLGKNIFYENYLKCIENNIEYNIEYQFIKECNHYFKKYNKKCIYREEELFNIQKYFKKIKFQKKDGNFIPDLLLIDENDKNKIFVEIFVTHRVSDEKINSKNRIIEIKLKEEKDVELITKNILSYKDSRVNFYNIQNKYVKNDCEGKCRKYFNVLFLNNSGEINLDNITLNELENETIIEYYILEENDEYNNDLVKVFAAKCAKKNLPVKNCNICRYHMLDKYKNNKLEPIYCKYLKFVCSSMEAENCDSYVQDYRIINRIKIG